MLSEEQGVKAIIALQACVGVTESEEKAKAGWERMTDSERRSTEAAHKAVCGGFDGDSTRQ